MAAKHINPDITVIGVEPCDGADTAASLRAGHLITLPAVPGTIADGLPWEVNKMLLDDVVTVTDDCIVAAMKWAFDLLKIVTEPSGAVALAALANRRPRPQRVHSPGRLPGVRRIRRRARRRSQGPALP